MKKAVRRNARKRETPSTWKAIVAASLCVLLFAAGFFLAARQHFLSMDYGMRNSKLRRQIEDLESEKRRLILAREVSLSPAEIKKAAKRLGLLDAAVTAAPTAQLVPASAKSGPQPGSDGKRTSDPLVIRTASVASTRDATPVTAVAKPDKPERVDRPRRVEVVQRQTKKAGTSE